MDQVGNFWAQTSARGALSATPFCNPQLRSLQRVSQGKGEPRGLLLHLGPMFPPMRPHLPLAATLDG